ncbi:MAG: methionyl-tRNA formyltransferase [Anaerovibrio sp.]|uniref:methionyl-tRNA formyltransferase n=1 Tax=Anaerovibrio sp. TaxID=1872532 RepID=UPI0025FAA269|nr:methionyl-tRNA formyltransferase [Anaerovibrio sp.]MCR5177317.1 methionyl-tRNA formyltransferase [Anaerovibrio sp.]
MKRLRTVFMGTPDFAVDCLRVMHEKTDVAVVVTQPDRPKGRGQKLTPSPVKVKALEYGIPVWQPEKIKAADCVNHLREIKPDLIVVVAFGQILSQEILDIPPLGCVNVHASLLPRYRGAAPIHWSVINGETETGVTTMMMDAGLDTGDMLLKSRVEITADMTTGELHDKLARVGSGLLADTVDALMNGNITREKQDGSLSNYASMLTKETGHIDWTRSAAEIHNLVRGLNSWPVAWTVLNGKNYKVWRTRVLDDYSGQPGQVLELTKTGFIVAAGTGAVEVLEIQPPSKKRMSAGDFVRGNGISTELIFD